MSESPRQDPTKPATREALGSPSEVVGRYLFMIAGSILLATLVSCMCNPVR